MCADQDIFGFSVGISGNKIATGAPFSEAPVSDAFDSEPISSNIAERQTIGDWIRRDIFQLQRVFAQKLT